MVAGDCAAVCEQQNDAAINRIAKLAILRMDVSNRVQEALWGIFGPASPSMDKSNAPATAARRGSLRPICGNYSEPSRLQENTHLYS
jgi:hypothetical protein